MRVWTWAMKRGGPFAEFSIYDDGLEIAVCYTSEDARRITDACNAAEQRQVLVPKGTDPRTGDDWGAPVPLPGNVDSE